MPQGGTLSIEVEVDSSADQLTIRFADEGVGMDSRQRQGYFQPFSSSFAEGTGLGAAIVYRLVQEHGGRVHLESAPERGTRVSIIIPRTRESSEPRKMPRLALQAAGG